jgi:hypothetical protein
MMFDEITLRNEIISKWGEHGAHTDVYDMMLRIVEEHRWLKYPENKPKEYGKYEVYRAGCKKQHYEIWNNLAWAYNNNDITHFRKIITPR